MGSCRDPSATCRKRRGTPVHLRRACRMTKQEGKAPIPRHSLHGWSTQRHSRRNVLRGRAEAMQEGPKGVVGEMGGVGGCGRQAAESGGERIGGDFQEFVEFPSLNLFR